MLALTDPTKFHRTLAQFNVSRVAPAMPLPNWQAALHSDLKVRLAEGQYLETLRGHVAPMLGDFSGDSCQCRV